MKKVDVKDTCTICKFDKDGYGDLCAKVQKEVKCLFLFGQTRNSDRLEEEVSTDAHAYLDIDNKFVQSIMTEDMQKNSYYFMINRYGKEDWYKIERIKIGRTVLTDNVDNDVHVFLKKTVKPI